MLEDGGVGAAVAVVGFVKDDQRSWWSPAAPQGLDGSDLNGAVSIGLVSGFDYAYGSPRDRFQFGGGLGNQLFPVGDDQDWFRHTGKFAGNGTEDYRLAAAGGELHHHAAIPLKPMAENLLNQVCLVVAQLVSRFNAGGHSNRLVQWHYFTHFGKLSDAPIVIVSSSVLNRRENHRLL